MTEEQDAIQEVEIAVKAHRLGEFVRNPDNREALKNRRHELVAKAYDVTWDEWDILTQGAVGHFLWGLVKNPSSSVIDDFKIALAIGYILGKEEK